MLVLTLGYQVYHQGFRCAWGYQTSIQTPDKHLDIRKVSTVQMQSGSYISTTDRVWTKSTLCARHSESRNPGFGDSSRFRRENVCVKRETMYMYRLCYNFIIINISAGSTCRLFLFSHTLKWNFIQYAEKLPQNTLSRARLFPWHSLVICAQRFAVTYVKTNWHEKVLVLYVSEQRNVTNICTLRYQKRVTNHKRLTIQ